MNNGTIVFDEELFKKNVDENIFPEENNYGGLSKEDLEQLKKEGLI